MQKPSLIELIAAVLAEHHARNMQEMTAQQYGFTHRLCISVEISRERELYTISNIIFTANDCLS